MFILMFEDKIFQSSYYLQLGGSLYLSLTGEGGLGLEDGHPWPGETCHVRLSDVTNLYSILRTRPETVTELAWPQRWPSLLPTHVGPDGEFPVISDHVMRVMRV